jgi:uncharacterized protein (TIGR03086 family)
MNENTTTPLMSENATMTVMAEAGAAVAAVVRAGAGANLAGPTPCTDYDLRTLLRHFVGTSGAFVRAGQTKALDPDDPWGSNATLDEQDWAGQLAGQVEAMSKAWSQPAAWTGTVEGAQMSASAIGELGLIEVLLHGWDVARASGQSLSVSEQLGEELLRCLTPTLEQGRQFEVYGREIPVANDASAFIRALALSGRDPDWRP